MARHQGFYLDPSWFRQIEEWIQDNRQIERNFRWGMDAIIMLYAHFTLAGAQKRSLGPVDPSQRITSAAWKIPVRRISGDYFAGWYTKRVAPGVWHVGNTSREAYFIEFGINHVGTGAQGPGGQRVRIRRPILKLAVLEAINIANSTRMDINAFSKILGAGGIYHSPALYETASHGAGRTYPISPGLVDQLRSMAGSGAG